MAEIAGKNKYPIDILTSWKTALWVGIFLRLVLFFTDGSLWRDEAKLLMSISSVPLGDLFLELPLGQRAPFALALLWKYIMEGLAGSTLLLRGPSVIAGISQLLIFAFIVLKTNPKTNKLRNAVIWITAVSPNLILFGNQVKPYVFDVFFSTLLIGLALPFFWSEKQKAIHAIALILGSWISLLSSFPSWFVVAGICLGIFVEYGFKRMRLLATLSCGSLAIVIFIYTASGEPSNFLLNFWAAHFPAAKVWWWTKALAESLFWGSASPTYLSAINLFYVFGWLFLLLCGFGAYNLWRSKRQGLLCILLIPTISCLIASALHKYPYGNRLILFMMPQINILVAFGLIHITRQMRLRDPIAAPNPRREVGTKAVPSKAKLQKAAHWGLWIMVVLCSLISMAEYLRPCKGVKQGLGFIALHEKKGDTVLVDEYASQVVNYYRLLAAKDNQGWFPRAELVIPRQNETEESGKLTAKEATALLPSESRVWLIAEPEGYHRRLNTSFLPITNSMAARLMESRKVIYYLKVPRVLVICFSEES